MSNLLVQNIKHTGGTTAMSVDSGGRVQFPNKPAYHVYRKTGGGGSGVTGVVAWNTAKVNVGTMCNLSTGIATIPVSGLYHLYFVGLSASSSGGQMAGDVVFRIETSTDNGTSFSAQNTGFAHYVSGATGYINVTASVTLDLTASTQVRNQITSNHAYIDNSDEPYTYAGGYLIG